MKKGDGQQFAGDVKVPGIAQKQVFGAVAEGESVKLQFGNVAIRMDYVDALKLSQWIRMAAKEAKRNAGDISRHWSIIAAMDDANV